MEKNFKNLVLEALQQTADKVGYLENLLASTEKAADFERKQVEDAKSRRDKYKRQARDADRDDRLEFTRYAKNELKNIAYHSDRANEINREVNTVKEILGGF